MNRIDKLIAELCPEGVEFKELGEVCEFQRGQSITKKNTIAGDIPVIAGGQKPAYYHNSSNRIGQTIAVSGSGAYAGFVSYWEIPIFLSDAFSVNPLKELLLTKYVYHFLKHNQEKIHGKQKGSGVPHVHGSDIAKFPIPIPPLPIQQEIVRILDTFTDLDAELQTELEARKKQYEHYRNQLLNFEGKDVEWNTLGEVSKILRGKAITEKETTSGVFPVVANAPNPIYFHGEYNRRGETIVIARSGAYSGLVSYWNKPFFLTDAFSIHPDNTLFITKFVYYFLKNRQEKIHQMQKGSGVPHVRAKEFETYSVPIPSLSVQQRIVSILDKFEALVNVELPAEIVARKKQYEYYREKLLTFKKAE